MSDRSKRRGSWLVLGCVSGLLVSVCALLCFCFTTCNPTDRVDVTFGHVPAGTTQIGIVADANTSAELMGRYLAPPMAPFGITKAGGGIEWEWHEPANAAASSDVYHVAWVPASRYGVVTKSTAGAWTITWFNAADVPIEGRLPLFGGGRVELDLAKGQREQLPEQRAKKLGLDF